MEASRSVPLGKAADIKPGELALFEVNGVRMAIANADGRFFAVSELCTHEQCSLVEEGTIEGTTLTCGCHGAQFDLATGAVLAPPATEPLRVFPLHLNRGDIVVEV
jgi:nitrite reductase/ring-hydroxylating ferredoxin subunit